MYFPKLCYATFVHLDCEEWPFTHAQTQLHALANIQKRASHKDTESSSNGSRMTTLAITYFAELNQAAALVNIHGEKQRD